MPSNTSKSSLERPLRLRIALGILPFCAVSLALFGAMVAAPQHGMATGPMGSGTMTMPPRPPPTPTPTPTPTPPPTLPTWPFPIPTFPWPTPSVPTAPIPTTTAIPPPTATAAPTPTPSYYGPPPPIATRGGEGRELGLSLRTSLLWMINRNQLGYGVSPNVHLGLGEKRYVSVVIEMGFNHYPGIPRYETPLTLTANIFLRQGKKLQPYIVFPAFGAVIVSDTPNPSPNGLYLYGAFGLGLAWNVSRHFALHSEVRYGMTELTNNAAGDDAFMELRISPVYFPF